MPKVRERHTRSPQSGQEQTNPNLREWRGVDVSAVIHAALPNVEGQRRKQATAGVSIAPRRAGGRPFAPVIMLGGVMIFSVARSLEPPAPMC